MAGQGMLFPIYLLALLATGYLLGYRGTSLRLGWVGINQALLSAVLYVRAGLKAQANTEPTHGYPLPTEPCCWWDWARCFLRVMRLN